MSNDFTALALSTAVASAALLLLTAGAAWAGAAHGVGTGPAGPGMTQGHGPSGCMHRSHPNARYGSAPYRPGPRVGAYPPGPRYGHPGPMYRPMQGWPAYGMPPGAWAGQGVAAQPMPGTPGVGHSPADTAEAAKPDVTALADQASRVDIRGMQFTPAELRVSVGDTVIWTHSDRAPHTVTGREAAGPESQTLQPGSTFSYRFDEPGTYEYYCALHPSMSGSIIVE